MIPTDDPVIAGKMRQFLRLLLSYGDFKHANRLAKHILTLDYWREENEGRGFVFEALNCAMVVAYCRPFSGNRGEAPDLPGRFLRLLTPEERGIHDLAMAERNTLLAHSDAAGAWASSEPFVQVIGPGLEVLVPNFYTRSPLTREPVTLLQSASGKLLEAVVMARHEREDEMMPYFKKLTTDEVVALIRAEYAEDEVEEGTALPEDDQPRKEV